MNQQDQLLKKNQQKQKLSQNEELIIKQMTEEEKLRKKIELIQSLNCKNTNKRQKSEDQEITCFICKQYFVKPTTAKCGHSFCEFCLQQYFLFSKQCPICHKVIRGLAYTYNNAINQYIENFINEHHRNYKQFYLERIQKYKAWKSTDRQLTILKAGMTVDVRDQNYVWCKGIVIRIISRVGEPVKFLKVQYQTQNMLTKQQEIRANNERIAREGFYTSRKQIPNYRSHQISPSKKA